MTPTTNTWTGYDSFWPTAEATTEETSTPVPADAYAAFAAAV